MWIKNLIVIFIFFTSFTQQNQNTIIQSSLTQDISYYQKQTQGPIFISTLLSNQVQNQPSHQEDTPITPQQQEPHHHLTPSDQQFWQCLALALLLSIGGAFCSGMGVGLLSISKLELKMMLNKKNDNQYKLAQRILSVVSNHHLFLVTLLIMNAICLQSLPLVIHQLMPDWAAILTSTFIVLIAAQIIPQAVCTGPHKLTIAYYAAPIILVMIKIFWILAYPTAKLLDYLIDHDHDDRIQHKDFANFLNQDKFLKQTQKMLLTATLQLRGERVQDVMIAVKDSFIIQQNQTITQNIVKQIQKKAYSNILVYKQKVTKITGVIKVKQFAVKYLRSKQTLKPKDMIKPNNKILTVYRDTNLLQMMMLFQAKKTRIALVCNQKRKTDPGIKSIMYSKSDMVYKEQSSAQVIGIVFLYQLFSSITQLKQKIERQSSMILADNVPYERQMGTLGEAFLKK